MGRSSPLLPWPLVFLAVFGCGREEPVSERIPDPQPKSTVSVPAEPEELVEGLATRTVVLTYHDMVPKRNRDALWFDCTPQELEDQLDSLAKGGKAIVRLSDVVEGLAGKREMPKDAVAISFADNYEGFYTYAWPILRDRKVPVTLFVHTDFVGSRQGRPKMTWEQLRELSASGLVDVESQTRSHPADLGKLDDDAIRRELEGSKKKVEEEIGKPCLLLAYPNGKWSARCEEIAREVGYRAAFTEEQRPAESATNLFNVPRYVHTKLRKAVQDSEHAN
ncbi:MAG: polysaccharide deacetylase family protein [Fimbriimonadaceae bacterium]|nr:polysaccharide deacetylase family protein [Fimbriimonadaceae bacterium]QYK55097.1 MAG: polysaccharide deacetylase family protein [Fimbriimonadaceae bacterium]